MKNLNKSVILPETLNNKELELIIKEERINDIRYLKKEVYLKENDDILPNISLGVIYSLN